MAYFEVSKDASRPFVVQTSSSQIEVLGTEFCVEDYAGRPHLTTLVSGSVAVKSGKQRCLLIPGQQADISPEGLTIREVDTYYYKAWKEGYFLFRHTPLNELMATLAEWYDLKYTFEDRSLEKILISARLYKLDDADQLFAILAATNKVKFRRQGKEVTLVRP